MKGKKYIIPTKTNTQTNKQTNRIGNWRKLPNSVLEVCQHDNQRSWWGKKDKYRKFGMGWGGVGRTWEPGEKQSVRAIFKTRTENKLNQEIKELKPSYSIGNYKTLSQL